MLISESYRQEQAALHAKGNYGTASLSFGGIVSNWLNRTGAKEILDYGCGAQQNLMKVIKVPQDVFYIGYEPAVPELSAPPEPAEFVACIDVLEHIEPECLDDVLNDLRRVTKGHGFFSVHTGPAVKVLSDGRNAHLIQEPPEWWFPKLSGLFDILAYQRLPNGFYVVVT